VPSTTISALIVAYEDPEAVQRCIASLQRQTLPPTEIVVADNHPSGHTARLLNGQPGVRVVNCGGQNTGYTGGAERAAESASGELLFFINPDATPAPECLQQLANELTSDPSVVVAGAQALMPDGRTNAGENPVHVSGLSWCGRYLQPRETGAPRDAFAVSGCAMLVRASAFARLGGFRDRFFMYYDDSDFCWRARMAGNRVRYCPNALVEHDYADKGAHKWLWVERNRLWMVLTNYERATLIRMTPLLLAVEAMMWAAALAGGWWRYKVRSYHDVARSVAWMRFQRKLNRYHRRIPDSELLPAMAAELRVGPMPLQRLINPLMRGYVHLIVKRART